MHMTPLLAAVIDLDVTYFFQLALFLGLVVVLNQLAFKPLLALFERRRGETLEREKQASEGSEEAEGLLQQYQSEMGEATSEGWLIEIASEIPPFPSNQIASARSAAKPPIGWTMNWTSIAANWLRRGGKLRVKLSLWRRTS